MSTPVQLDPETQDFYRRALGALSASGLPYLIGGAYAFARYTGINRHTKDLDVFVHQDDVDGALAVLQDMGCCTEVTFPHWLGKASATAICSTSSTARATDWRASTKSGSSARSMIWCSICQCS